MKILDDIVNLLEKVFVQPWVAAAFAAGGVMLIFAVCLLLGCLTGDFIKNKKATRAASLGEIEAGLGRLKSFAPAFDKTREVSPPAADFDYNKIIGYPYSYSLIKRLPSITLVSTAFFTVLAAAASVIAAGAVTHYMSFMLIFVPLIGLILYIISVIISGSMLKKATNNYHKMIDIIKDITVRPAAEVAIEDEALPEAVAYICKKIEDIALVGGADYAVLSGLLSEITAQQQLNHSAAAQEKLSAALDVLSVLIDSAM